MMCSVYKLCPLPPCVDSAGFTYSDARFELAAVTHSEPASLFDFFPPRRTQRDRGEGEREWERPKTDLVNRRCGFHKSNLLLFWSRTNRGRVSTTCPVSERWFQSHLSIKPVSDYQYFLLSVAAGTFSVFVRYIDWYEAFSSPMKTFKHNCNVFGDSLLFDVQMTPTYAECWT